MMVLHPTSTSKSPSSILGCAAGLLKVKNPPRTTELPCKCSQDALSGPSSSVELGRSHAGRRICNSPRPTRLSQTSSTLTEKAYVLKPREGKTKALYRMPANQYELDSIAASRLDLPIEHQDSQSGCHCQS